MSSNISGFQGVNTPLQSMTNGQYTLADYTNMNRVLSARIAALEKAVAFNPNNVTIGGYLNVQPNSTNPGNLAVSSNALISGALQVNKSATINQNLNVGGTLAVAGGITFNNLNVTTLSTTTINNSGAVTAATFTGNGAALTGVLDNTKLPLTGGTITGPLTLTAGNIISGNGSGLTNINDITKLPLAGGSMTGSLSMNSQNITNISTARAALLTIGTQSNVIGQNTTAFNQSSNFTEYISYATSGSHRWFCNTAANTQVQSLTMTDTTITTPCSITASSYSGNGAALTGITATDSSKLPLTGGTLTGNVQFATPACAINYKQNQFANWAIPSFISAQLNPSTHDVFRYTGGVNTTISLTNDTTSTFFYQDGMKQVTILKPVNGVGAYTILVLPPAGYVISSPGVDNAVNYLMDAAASSVTFMVISAAKIGAANGQLYVISKT